MWTGLSAWLAHHLRVKIDMKLHHLLRDTKEFVDDLRHLHWQDGMRMVKIDIKEFSMSGKPGFLSHACSELFCDETEDFQQLVARAVDWLCRKTILCSRNSCLISPTELREGLACGYFTVVKYLTLVSGSLLKEGC